ncbi:MAG: phosphate ABC transporter substrate-binding protein PstS [Propionibacteriaceae bacterium]|jgi:phosphate transport system substrate-binding protein|nr:phosphate ABC transporter substrate-binding protein PstS [Propionibacteriaceae bacterium]
MKYDKSVKSLLAVIAVAASLLLTACSASNETPNGTPPVSDTGTPKVSGTLNLGGSSAQTAAQTTWRAGFQDANAAANVNYDPVGSGAGRTGFADGAYAMAGTDDAFKISDIASSDFKLCVAGTGIVELPVYISPIAVAYNLPGVTNLNLDAATTAGIFAGAITKWNDPAIVALNAGTTLPELTITAVHRSDKSGTTGNFTDYLSDAAASVWTFGRSETWPESLGGEAAEKTQGMRQAIEAANGAIGYLDASQASGLGMARLMVRGNAVAPVAEAAAKALAGSQLEPGRDDADLVFDINRVPTDASAYPLIMVSYLVACQQYQDGTTAELVKAYVSHVVSREGQAAAAGDAGSVSLWEDAALQRRVGEAAASIR